MNNKKSNGWFETWAAAVAWFELSAESAANDVVHQQADTVPISWLPTSTDCDVDIAASRNYKDDAGNGYK